MTLQIAGKWFERRRVDADITHMWEPHVDPLLRCNIWHVRGRNRDLMIDTGLGIASLTEAAQDLLDKRVTAVATHTHYDHIGGHHEFAECLVHPTEEAALRHAAVTDFVGLRREDIPAALVTSIEAAGYRLPSILMDAVPTAGYRLQDYRLRDVRGKITTVSEGDLIDLGNRAFEVLHLPGHSPGGIGLWDARQGVLFSGDAIYNGPLIGDLPGSDRRAYVNTLKRLLDMPAHVVHAGHEPSFGRKRLIEIARQYLERWDKGEISQIN